VGKAWSDLDAHLTTAHKMYGRLKWEDVVMPVAELAQGWRVGRELARRLRVSSSYRLVRSFR
jgi:gamma-glutamyltranspeptidase/glutathione hydrolase/leukotriene-C4 hydrolase